ncbi:MAG: Holliday junction resolvase RuvX [Caldilineaceae bacterium]|nr:Holliday junction resolvase RuvX [Caldilineaceae bacterium]
MDENNADTGAGAGQGPGGRRPAGKLLALDVGLARIGVAVCDPLRLAARPLTVVRRRSRNEDFARLATLVREQEAQAIICGLPLNMDGTEGSQAQTVRKWALRLAQALRVLLSAPLPVIFWDERLTTFGAQELMAEYGLKIGEDAVAAAVLLQSYLDAERRGDERSFGRIDLPARS